MNNHKHYKQQDHQFWWLSLECLKRCMDQNDLFHNAPPSWAFTNKQKLKLFTTFWWICRVQTKKQPSKTKDVQRCLTSPHHSLHKFCLIIKLTSKSTRFCKQLHVRHTQATREMWPQERIWVFYFIRKSKKLDGSFFFCGVGSFQMALFSAKLTATGLWNHD